MSVSTPLTSSANNHRSATAPAYYLGRPAHVWTEALRRHRRTVATKLRALSPSGTELSRPA
jgi:hypothetical protein